MTTNQIIVVSSIFWACVSNVALFRNTADDFPFIGMNIVYLASLWLLLIAVHVLVFSLLTFRPLIKGLYIPIFLLSAAAAYFMDSFNIVIDTSMLDNVFETDSAEAFDLLSFRLILYLSVIGLIPALLLWKIEIIEQPFLKALGSRSILVLGALAVIVATLLSCSSFYASFFREHKYIRYYANPIGFLFAGAKSITRRMPDRHPIQIKTIGESAQLPENHEHRELVIFVVGETARADHFSLNGYPRETNPRLANEGVVSFTNFWSCGTATAVSVPCMFSIYNQDDFNVKKARSTENILDLLKKVGVNILWVDNNSDSKGVADRMTYISHKNTPTKPGHEGEPRDHEMLDYVRDFVAANPEGDLFILLHQMGSHGPAYYKRYPAEFDVFQPACKTDQLNQCSEAEIHNAYDNTILYTDYFLHETISLLREYDDSYETVMMYVSDHGESLGEKGLYLHGMPKMIAPEGQTHVPAIIWAGDYNDDVDLKALSQKRDDELNHDNVFHTLMGLFEVQGEDYRPDLDLLNTPTKDPKHL